MELNPDHPVATSLRGQWHKLAALVMMKLGHREVVLTEADFIKINKLFPGGMAIVAHTREHDIHIYITTQAEADRIAAAEEAKK